MRWEIKEQKNEGVICHTSGDLLQFKSFQNIIPLLTSRQWQKRMPPPDYAALSKVKSFWFQALANANRH